ncbi:MAG: sodium/solute symporter [Planctomycetota bacterium]
MRVGALDLTILLAYLAATVAFGVWIGGRQRSASDYLLGGRDLPWWALLISIVATETSTATFLSVPGVAYGGGLPGTTGDLRYLQLPLGYIVGRTVATFVLLPLYFRGELFTAYEVLRQRSGPSVRTLASGLFLVTRTLADGLRLYLTALVVVIMTGTSLPVAVAVVGVGTLVYTVFGGMRAVVWTDVVQFVVYMLGAVLAFGLLLADLPQGLSGLLADARAAGRLQVFDLGFDLASPFTFWAGLVGGAVLSIGTHGVDQLLVQRYLAARRQRDAARALLLSGPVVLVQFAFFLLLGLGLSAFYAAHPPAVAFTRSDAVFADFIVHHLPTGIVGIVLGAVFSAAMSTLSSSLNASASALVNDFVLPLTGRGGDDAYALRAAKIATVMFGVLQMAVGVSGLGGGNAVVNSVLAIASFTTGAILGLFALALLPGRNQGAALLGLACGLTASSLIVFLGPSLGVKLGWPWFALVSSTSTFVPGALIFLLASKPRHA